MHKTGGCAASTGDAACAAFAVSHHSRCGEGQVCASRSAATGGPPPFGYAAAHATVRDWLADPRAVEPQRVRDAIATLASLGYAPTALGAAKKSRPSGKQKKITGGCD